MSYGAGVRIAHVSDCYLPRTGGIETQVRALAMHQVANGDDVRVITATPGNAAGVEVLDEIPVHRVTMPLPLGLPIHLRTRHEVAQLLRRDPVDVVHVHAGVVSPFAWGAVRAARETGTPCVVTVHSIWGPIAGPGFALSDTLLRWSTWGVQVTAVSQTAARGIEAALPAVAPVLVTPNGIDAQAWRVEHVPGRDDELRLVSVMRLAPRKRLIPLLRIVEMAHRSLLGAGHLRLTIVGDGPERATAERFIRSRGLTGVVRLAGRLGADEIKDVFAHSDVFVQPSVKESFGLAALEARSAGLPVVARAQTGTSHFVRDGVEGVLVSSDRGMAQALIALARDPARVRTMAEHNLSTQADESWPSVLQQMRLAYAQPIARHAAG